MKAAIHVPPMTKITTEQLVDFLLIFKDEQKQEQEKMDAALRIFLGMTDDQIKALPAIDIMKVHQAIQDQLQQEYEVQRIIEIDGIRYGMIPNMERISVGEYGELDTFITPAFEGEVKHQDAFNFLSTLYRPVTEGTEHTTYQIEKYQAIDNSEIMKKAPASVYTAAVGFFLTTKLELLQGFLDYLEKEGLQLQDELAKLDSTIQNAGDGLKLLINSQMATIYNGKKQLHPTLMKRSHS